VPPSSSPSPEERARLFSLQHKIASKIVLKDRFSEKAVGGVDQAFITRKDGSEMVVSGAVALDSFLRTLSR